MLLSALRMQLFVLLCSLSLSVMGQVDDDWLDPFDMLNYDASTQSMRKDQEPENYPNVPTKRREYTQESQDTKHAELMECNSKLEELKRQNEDQRRKMADMSVQPACNPVFKRFLTKLLKDMERVGLASELNEEVLYDAKVRLNRQTSAEIRKFLDGGDSWKTGALDDALSQIVMGLKPHDVEAWKWRFEDTFGVEADTVIKVCVCVMVLVAIICTELWSTVSWFVQFRRLFAICFIISLVWNWFYLYKIAFAEHQNNIVKMDSFNDKCTGVKKLAWSDSLKEWFRSTLTLQDDPCKKYYEVLMVNPILLVPPTKAISVTITTFITEPLKHVGQGISEFLRALLKDLPITLQIPVLLTIVLSILVFMYGSVQAAFQYGIWAPLRRGRRDPPPPALDPPRPQAPQLLDADTDRFAGGDAPQRAPVAQIRQRKPNRARDVPARMVVETLRNSDRRYSEDEVDVQRGAAAAATERPEATSGTSGSSESEPEETPETPVADASSRAGDRHDEHSKAKTNSSQPKPDRKPNDLPQAKPRGTNSKSSQAKPSGGGVAPESPTADRQAGSPRKGRPTQTTQGNDNQVLEASPESKMSSLSLTNVETLGVPVQETTPTAST